MIRQAIEKIFNEYPTYDVKEVFPFAGNPLASFIRHDIPVIFGQELLEFPVIKWNASAGKGAWADAPWIAAFNPAITDSAQFGYYPVLLFTSSLDSVYLSLNQGITKIRQEFGDLDAIKKLKQNAEILRMRLGSSISDFGFSIEPIDLQARGKNTLLAYYQPGHAFGKVYKKDHLPSNQTLKDDLANILILYALAFSKGGASELDIDEQDQDSDDSGDVTLQEKLRYKQHRTIERNSNLGKNAKRIHGYTCQVCGFNFVARYGELGKEYIEAHHKTPLHMLPKDQFVTLSAKDDFAVVCSNCHRMLHRKNAPTDFNEFVKIFSH